MIDIVFPKDNETEFIKMAERLNMEGLCLVYSVPKDISQFQQNTKLKLSQGILCTIDNVKKYKGKYVTLLESPEDQTKLRHIIEKVKPDILFNLEFARRKDFMHHRASGLNHVLAKLARDNDVSIGFNFSKLLKANPQDRAVYMGRMMQNIRFAKKFGFNTVMASFTSEVYQMRPRVDIYYLIKLLGER